MVINPGLDASGNGNNWTPINIDWVVPGANYDIMVDVPTNQGTDTGIGGEVRGNYCTLNPLDKGTSISTSNGNLEFTVGGANNYEGIRATLGIPQSGKWYWETAYSGLGYISSLGVATSSASVQGTSFSKVRTIGTGSWYNSFNSGVVQYNTDAGPTFGSGGNVNWSGASQPSANDIYMVAVDMDSGKMWIGKNGTWFNSSGTANPATGVDPRWADLAGEVWFPYSTEASSSPITKTFNFGQRPFAYTAPSGFKALCTQNLPEPTVVDGGEYFNPVLYNATDGVAGSVTGVGFAPDFVWVKSRSGANSHGLFDKVRGVEKGLFSNLTNAEISSNTYLTAFNSDGFSHGGAGLIANGSLVAWNWKAGGTGVANGDGTIPSTVSANTTAGFSVVTYTGNSTANSTVGHGLGAAPGMVIIKNRSAVQNWPVAHSSLAANNLLLLDTTNSTISAGTRLVIGNNTTFTVGDAADYGITNQSGQNYVAYCFAPVAGYSAFGSYTGNGSTDGPFVYTGFRPRYIMLKQTNAVSQWYVYDTARNPYNAASNRLWPNLANAEGTGTYLFDILSNGFKFRNGNSENNGSGDAMIYVAFAENPFKLSRAR